MGRLAGAAALIAALTVLSRLAGFGRTAVFARTVTPNDLGDIYLAVNTVPNIVFEIVAGGALASMVVPLLAGAVAAGDRAAVSATASALLTWVVSVLVPLAVLVALFAGPIVALLAPDGAPAAQLDTGERMLRVFAPQLPLYGVGIVLTGVLQAHHRFAWPVLAPLLSSLTVIGAYVTFAVIDGRGTDVAHLSRAGELILSGGTTLGVAVLSLCLVIPLRGLGLRLRPVFALAPGTRRAVGGLALAGAVTVGAQQVAVLVALRLALDGPAGSVVQYNLAQTVYLLPWAVLAVPLATAAFPTLAAARTLGDTQRYADTLATAARGVLLLSCLGAGLLIGVAHPAAELLVDGPGVAPLAAGIIGFAPGLLGYALFAALSRALYARGDTSAAAAATAGGWAVAALAAVGLAAGLADDRRVLGLALANSAGMLVLGAVLVAVVARRAGSPALAGLGRAGFSGVIAGALAGLAGLGVGRLAGVLPTPPDVDAAIAGMLSGVCGTLVFLAVAYGLDRRDIGPLAGALRRRLRRRPEADTDRTGGVPRRDHGGAMLGADTVVGAQPADPVGGGSRVAGESAGGGGGDLVADRPPGRSAGGHGADLVGDEPAGSGQRPERAGAGERLEQAGAGNRWEQAGAGADPAGGQRPGPGRGGTGADTGGGRDADDVDGERRKGVGRRD